MEWKTVRLGDYISIKSGLAYKGSKLGHGNSILLGMGCVSFKDKFVMTGARPYNDVVDDRFCVVPGDIVLATRQQSDNLPILAMPAIIPPSFEGKRVIFGTNLYKVDNHSEISNRFLFWLLKHQHYVNYIAGVKSGTAVQMVTKKNVEDYKFLCPPKKEREKIADILWTYDSQIENNKKRIKLLEKMAENLYKEWFVRFRFPGYETAEFEGGVPKGWRIEKLKDVSSIVYGFPFNSSLFCSDASLNPVVRIRDIADKHTETYTSEKPDDKYLIHTNDVLIGMDGIFHMNIWTNDGDYLNQRVVKVTSTKPHLSNFFIFQSIFPQVKMLESIISGTTVAHLSAKDMCKMTILIPDKHTLELSFSRFESMMAMRNKLLIQNDLLSSQRDLLLPRLMSGKLSI